MSKINERCAGIDVGKRFLLCCVLTAAANEEPSPRTVRFDTTVAALIRLREWLVAERITHVVMESTGSYWIPIVGEQLYLPETSQELGAIDLPD